MFDFSEVTCFAFQNNLECKEYKTTDEFCEDVRLIYQNCYIYSDSDSEIYKMAQQLEEQCEREFSKSQIFLSTNVPEASSSDSFNKIVRMDNCSAKG